MSWFVCFILLASFYSKLKRPQTIDGCCIFVHLPHSRFVRGCYCWVLAIVFKCVQFLKLIPRLISLWASKEIVLAVVALRILCFAIQRNFGGQPLLLERMLQAMLPSGADSVEFMWLPQPIPTRVLDLLFDFLILFGVCNTRNFERWKIVFRTMTDHSCANVLNLQPFFFAALCQSAHVVLHVVLFLDVLNACSGCPLVPSLVGLFFSPKGTRTFITNLLDCLRGPCHLWTNIADVGCAQPF